MAWTTSTTAKTGFGEFLIKYKQPHFKKWGCNHFNRLPGPIVQTTRLLYIEIQVKFVGMRTQFDIVDFMFGFIFNPHVNCILGKNIAP